jgi:hypothetical protein
MGVENAKSAHQHQEEADDVYPVHDPDRQPMPVEHPVPNIGKLHGLASLGARSTIVRPPRTANVAGRGGRSSR